MSSRDSILAAVAANQPSGLPLPPPVDIAVDLAGLKEKFSTVVSGIGSRVVEVSSLAEIAESVAGLFPEARRIVAMSPGIEQKWQEPINAATEPHTLEDVDVALFEPHFAVAENGACWITEDRMGHRILPFICQHIVMVVRTEVILPTMHQAYAHIAAEEYGFAAFIAGPSKTADIEQSLVLGAHGPRSMTIFLLNTV